MNTLSDSEIIEICKNYRLPLNKICFKDDLPNELEKGFYIINLQSKFKNGNGTHWTAFYCSGLPSEINIYYDSFGFPAPEEVEEKIKPYIYNSKDIQNINTSSCGFYCIAFIKFLNGLNNKVDGYEKFLNLFNNETSRNEMILNNILYKNI